MTLSGVVSRAVGGSKLHLHVVETSYHPGHDCMALAVHSRDELPPDPPTFARTTGKGPREVRGVIESPPQLSVLAAGLFPHSTQPASPPTSGTDIQLPNITREKCMLDVIQFMADHADNQPDGYSHFHGAAIAIAAEPATPLDKGWPAPVTTAARQQARSGAGESRGGCRHRPRVTRHTVGRHRRRVAIGLMMEPQVPLSDERHVTGAADVEIARFAGRHAAARQVAGNGGPGIGQRAAHDGVESVV